MPSQERFTFTTTIRNGAKTQRKSQREVVGQYPLVGCPIKAAKITKRVFIKIPKIRNADGSSGNKLYINRPAVFHRIRSRDELMDYVFRINGTVRVPPRFQCNSFQPACTRKRLSVPVDPVRARLGGSTIASPVIIWGEPGRWKSGVDLMVNAASGAVPVSL